ncbi:MAG: phenylacetate--CoA ligase family protein [bacterium]
MDNFLTLPPEIQRKRAFNNLLTYIKHYVYPYHPYIRKTYKELGIDPSRIKTYDDFIQLPIITKSEYRKDPLSFILQPTFPTAEFQSRYDTAMISKRLLIKYLSQAIFNIPRDRVQAYREITFKEKIMRRIIHEWFPIHFHASAGSTGEPTPAVYTFYDIKKVLNELAYIVFLEPKDLPPDAPRATFEKINFNTFPGAPHLAFFQAVLTKFLVGGSSFDSFGGKVIPTEQQIRLFAQEKFNSITSVPSYLVYWLRKAVQMHEAGEIPDMPFFEGVILGAEGVSPELEAYILELAKRLGAHPKFRIASSYGSTELKWAFFEPDYDCGIHLDPRFYFWELLDPETKKPVKQGESGILVFSHIGWRGTVFVRYWTGDLIKGGLSFERCPRCGFTMPRLYPPIVRYDKDFTKIKGTKVLLPDLITAIRDIKGVENFQIIIDRKVPNDPFSMDTIKIRVHPHEGTNKDRLTELINQRVKAFIELTPDEIIFEDDGKAIESDLFSKTGIKAEYVIDKRQAT